MNKLLEQVESFLFLLYIILAISFYGFKGYTYVPQLVGVVLAVFYFIRLVLVNEKIIFSFSQKLILSFFIYLSISILLFFPYDFAFVKSFVQFFILFHIGVNILAKRGQVSLVLYGFIMGVAILIINRIRLSESILDTLSARIGSTAGNQNDYGFILSCATVLLLFELVRKKSSLLKQVVVWLVIIAIQIESFIYAGSRTGIAMSFFAIIIYLLYTLWKTNLFNKFILVGIGFVLISNLVLILPQLNTFNRIVTLTEDINKESYSVKSSSGLRLNFIKEGIRLWGQSPIWGHGSNRFRYINSVKHNYYSHNNFVELLSNNGIIGFVLFYGIHIFLLIQINQKWAIPKPPYLWWFNVFIVCLLIADMGRVSYYNKIYLLVLSILSGLLIFYKKRRPKTSIPT